MASPSHSSTTTPSLSSSTLSARHPQRSYRSAEPVLRTPAPASTSSRPPQFHREAGVLLAPGAAPALLGGPGRAGEVLAVRARPSTTALGMRDRGLLELEEDHIQVWPYKNGSGNG